MVTGVAAAAAAAIHKARGRVLIGYLRVVWSDSGLTDVAAALKGAQLHRAEPGAALLLVVV
jgi:hypothetical protein